MKWLKICALVLLTLAVMRAGSWGLGWQLTRWVSTRVRTAAVVANIIALLAFLLLLYLNLLPGEPMDLAAVVFGCIVFAIYTLTDLYWRPWKQKPR